MYLNTDPIHASALPISPDASEGMAAAVERLRQSYRANSIQCGDHAQYEIENAGVPKEQRSDWPMPSFDARDWAKSMSERFGMPFDEALPWCASMLMRGYDERAARIAAEHGYDANGSPVSEAPAEKHRPTIAEIEAILNSEEDVAIEILPNGEIRAKGSGEAVKPVTMRERLGGEYGEQLSRDLIEAARDSSLGG